MRAEAALALWLCAPHLVSLRCKPLSRRYNSGRVKKPILSPTPPPLESRMNIKTGLLRTLHNQSATNSNKGLLCSLPLIKMTSPLKTYWIAGKESILAKPWRQCWPFRLVRNLFGSAGGRDLGGAFDGPIQSVASENPENRPSRSDRHRVIRLRRFGILPHVRQFV